MELKQIDRILFKTLFLLEAGIVITQVLNVDTLTSVLFMVTFPVTILLWVRSIRQTVTQMDIIMILAAAMAIVGVFVNAGTVSASVSFEYLKKLIMFIMTLLFFQTAHRTRINDDMTGFINRLVDFLTIFLMLSYLLFRDQMHMLNGRVTMYLTFRFSNPNLTALFLMLLYMLQVHRLFVREKWYVKLLHIVMIASLAWFMLATQSRNCLLALAVFTVFVLWLMFRKRGKMYISKGWATLFSVAPAVFVMGYMLLINNQWVQKVLSFLVGEGKQLDSRVSVWGRALENLKQSPLFGAYYQISQGTGTSHMHNSHMDIAASYGIPVLILVCVLLAKYLHQGGRVYSEKSSYIYILGFACVITLGMGEAAVFSGGLGIYIFAGTFLLLANRANPRDMAVG